MLKKFLNSYKNLDKLLEKEEFNKELMKPVEESPLL
jgi:hypothetical protein